MRTVTVDRFPMKFASGAVTPDMWESHIGGLEGFLRDLGAQIPEQLIITARANYGLRLARNSLITVHREVNHVKGVNGDLDYNVYRMVAEGEFIPTRCVADFNHHERPHSLSCPLAGMA